MHASRYALLMTSFALLPLSLTGCDDADGSSDGDHDHHDAGHMGNDSGTEDGGEDAATSMAVSLQFAALVGENAFACNTTFTGLGSSDSEMAPLDFRFYVHDVELLNEDGDAVAVELTQDGKWQVDDVALLDFEDKSGTCANGTTDVNSTVVGTVPVGTYSGIQFKVGVPFELNHADVTAADSPLNLSGLWWSWQSGYKFMRIDMTEASGESPNVFNMHLGSVGCEKSGDGAGDPVTSCERPNRPSVVFEDFDIATDTVTVDYAALVAGIDLSTDGGGAPGCMSGPTDPECAGVFEHLGVSLETGAPAAGQTVFGIETP